MTETQKKPWRRRLVIIILAYVIGFVVAFWLRETFYRWFKEPFSGQFVVASPRQPFLLAIKFAQGIGILLAAVVFASFFGPRGRSPTRWAGAYLLAGCAASGAIALSFRASNTVAGLGAVRFPDSLPSLSIGLTGAAAVIALAFLHRRLVQGSGNGSDLPG